MKDCKSVLCAGSHVAPTIREKVSVELMLCNAIRKGYSLGTTYLEVLNLDQRVGMSVEYLKYLR